MELFLIRHGQSSNNLLPDATGRVCDPALTPVGEQQADRVASHFAAGDHLHTATQLPREPALHELFCSPMLRAVQTTAPIAAALELEPAVWVDTHEMGGVYLDEVPGREPVGYPGLTRDEMAHHLPRCRVPDGVGPDGWWRGTMETWHAGQGRAIGVATTLRARAAEPVRLGLVTHGGFGSCLLQALGRQLPADGFYYEHNNTGVTHLLLNGNGSVVLRYHNQHVHLPASLLT